MMERKYIAFPLGICIGVLIFFVWLWAADAQNAVPKSFPSPTDPSSVRMSIVNSTLQIIVPVGQTITTRQSMDKSHNVIEINLAVPIPAPVAK